MTTTTATTEGEILAILSTTGPAMGFPAAAGAIATWTCAGSQQDDLTPMLEAMVEAGTLRKCTLSAGRGNPPVPAYAVA